MKNIPTPTINNNATKTDLTAYIVDRAYGATGANTMFSPLSLDFAIGTVAEGVAPAHNGLMAKLLGKENYAPFATEYMRRVNRMNLGEVACSPYEKYKTVFDIANAVWYRQGMRILDSYKAKVAGFCQDFRAANFFDKKGVADAINAWCKDKTRNMIPQVINEHDIDEGSQAVVVNAVYFESPWAKEWRVVGPAEKFNKFDAESNVKMIATSANAYYENEHATAFGCRYKNGLEFIGILPKAEGDFLIQDLNLESLIASKTNEHSVKAKMPAFKFDNQITDLAQILTDAGYGALFNDAMGIFDQMMAEGEKNVPLAISKIIQVDAIELDENGTKAAAVTAMIMKRCMALYAKETKEVILDRPFAFVIYDPEMQQIVFVGKVVNP